MTQEKMMKKHWLDIDPLTSLNAMNVISWSQEFDIKLLVKLKLHSQGFKFDTNFQRNLENFCRMKYRIEKQQESVIIKSNKREFMNRSNQKVTNLNLKKSMKICKDITRFLLDNEPYFILEFKPGHQARSISNNSDIFIQ